jgi:hypothetical protein
MPIELLGLDAHNIPRSPGLHQRAGGKGDFPDMSDRPANYFALQGPGQQIEVTPDVQFRNMEYLTVVGRGQPP